MRTSIRLLLVGVALCLAWCLLPARAATGIPDLRGTWEGDYEIVFLNGSKKAHDLMSIQYQDGPRLRGWHRWRHEEPNKPVAIHVMGPLAGETMAENRDPFVGIVGFDNRTVDLAEEGDTGVMRGELVSPDLLRLTYVQGGVQARVYRIELRRTGPPQK